MDNFDDLRITYGDFDGDGDTDTLIEYGKGTEDGLILLIDIGSVSESDFMFL